MTAPASYPPAHAIVATTGTGEEIRADDDRVRYEILNDPKALDTLTYAEFIAYVREHGGSRFRMMVTDRRSESDTRVTVTTPPALRPLDQAPASDPALSKGWRSDREKAGWCRCGKHWTEQAPQCEWHPAVVAEFRTAPPAADPALDALDRLERNAAGNILAGSTNRDAVVTIRAALADRITPAEASLILTWTGDITVDELEEGSPESALIARLGKIAEAGR
jgi:hypothetical protein